jgi:tetratricopeptide (TPR) repeat protein
MARRLPSVRRVVHDAGTPVRVFLAAVLAATLAGCAATEPPPETPAAKPAEPRARLDEVQRLASERDYDAAIKAFEAVQTEAPDAIASLDGLKMVVVYAEVGELDKHEALTRWLVDRHRTPKTATDAERSVKGYIVHPRAKDPALLKHAVAMTQLASERAKADGEEEYQGFFNTSRGIALYRTGRYPDASKWLFTAVEHPNVYVRTLALPFFAMSEFTRGNRKEALNAAEHARQAAAQLPVPGTDEYSVGWTDVLMSKRAIEEMETVLSK